jgi:DNA-binding XRE family transcriptional regulator
MKSKTIPIEKSFAKWRKDPEFRKEYAPLEEEFMVSSALIEARRNSKATQEQIAKRMDKPQSAIAKLEGGKSNPTIKTLRSYAKATGTRLRISFEPKGAR